MDPAAMYEAFDSPADAIVEFLAWLAARHRLPAAPRVLDVGCGPGRLLEPLAALGWSVAACEPEPSFHARAQARGRELRIPVAQAGFGDIAHTDEFDLVLGINGSFAHVGAGAERVDALRRCAAALRPGGLLCLDLPNLLRILFEYAGPLARISEVDGTPVRLERRHAVDYERGLFLTHEEYWVEAPSGAALAHRAAHPYTITVYPDLVAACEEAGLVALETYTSFSAREPEPLGPGRMIVVARLPAAATCV